MSDKQNSLLPYSESVSHLADPETLVQRWDGLGTDLDIGKGKLAEHGHICNEVLMKKKESAFENMTRSICFGFGLAYWVVRLRITIDEAV